MILDIRVNLISIVVEAIQVKHRSKTQKKRKKEAEQEKGGHRSKTQKKRKKEGEKEKGWERTSIDINRC